VLWCEQKNMVLTVTTVSSLSEYHSEGYHPKNDGVGVSLVTYTVMNFSFWGFLAATSRRPRMDVTSGQIRSDSSIGDICWSVCHQQEVDVLLTAR
jgi:hypothetical protein